MHPTCSQHIVPSPSTHAIDVTGKACVHLSANVKSRGVTTVAPLPKTVATLHDVRGGQEALGHPRPQLLAAAGIVGGKAARAGDVEDGDVGGFRGMSHRRRVRVRPIFVWLLLPLLLRSALQKVPHGGQRLGAPSQAPIVRAA